jgi:hypothetical protein
MAAAVVLLSDDGSGNGEVTPSSQFVYQGGIDVGGYPAREFRRESDGALFILQRIRSGGTPKRWLVVVWTAFTQRDPALTAFAALTSDLGANVIKGWRVTQTSGRLMVPTLDSDATAAGTAVKAVWPAEWVDGSGARFVGNVIA